MALQKKISIATIIVLFSVISSLNAAQLLFTPTLLLSEEYTSNVNLEPTNEVEDFISTAGIGLKGEILGRTAGLELEYNPSYSKYQDNEEFDNWRHEASLYTWKNLKRSTKLEFRNTYLRTSDPFDESAELEGDGPAREPVIGTDVNRRGRNEYFTNTALARLAHQFGSNDEVYFSFEYSLLRDEDRPVDEPIEDNEDNDIWTPSAGLLYNFGTNWSMEFDTTYQITDFDDENKNDRDELNAEIRLLHNFNRLLSGYVGYRHTVLNFDQEIDENYEIYRPAVGIRLNFQDNASITIGAGYYIQEFEESETEEGLNVESDIYKQWNFRYGYFGINGSSGYDIDDDGSEDNGLTVFYQGGLTAGYSFTPRVASNFTVSYRFAEFPNQTPKREDQTLTAGAGFDWQMLQWLAVGLAYTYSTEISDDPANEYTEHSAIATITMTPSSPFRLN